jgi:F0F1-type ATP synthase assembly protein I
VPEPGADQSGDAGLRGRDLINLGGLLAAAVIAGTVLGLLLDRALGTEPVFTMAGVFLGILAGGLGFWARVHAALK